MKLLKYLIPALIVLSSIGVAHAQVSNPQWKINNPSSTITPINSSLQVPCANIVGGCGGAGGNVTSTTGLTNTGNVTSTSFTASSTTQSNIAYLGNTFNIPKNYATAGCPWGATTDLGACIMDAYESVSSTASSTVINVPILPPFTTYTTKINFNNLNEYADLECASGQILEYTGTVTATSGALTYNEGDASTANLKIAHLGGSNCHIALGSSAPSANATSTAVYVGGTNGESALMLNNMGGIYANSAYTDASNTFMVITNNFVADGDNHANIVATGSNSGETLTNNGFRALDIANASTSTLPTCILTGSNAFTELDYVDGSNLDDCGATISPTVGKFTFSGNAENPAASGNANYPKYPFLTLQSSTALIATVSGGINLDSNSATSTPTSVIVNDANLILDGVAFGKNGSQSATNLVDDSGNAASVLTVRGLTYYSGGFTNLAQLTGQVVPPQSSFTNATTTFNGTTNFGTSTSLGATVNVWGNANSEAIYFSNGNILCGSGWGINTAGNGNNTGFFCGANGWEFGGTTPSTQVQIAASSTLRLGVAGLGAWSGCVEQYDHTNSSTLWYSYPNNGVYVNTSTKPAWCQ